MIFFFFFNDTATTEIYTLSLHDALPIFARMAEQKCCPPLSSADVFHPVVRILGNAKRLHIRDLPGKSPPVNVIGVSELRSLLRDPAEELAFGLVILLH